MYQMLSGVQCIEVPSIKMFGTYVKIRYNDLF